MEGRILRDWGEFYSSCLQNINLAVVGGGGKTGLISRMAGKLQAMGKPALVTVTTRLGRDQLPELKRVEAKDLNEAEGCAEQASRGERLLLAGPFVSMEKLAGIPVDWFPELRKTAGRETIFLIEADGSAGRPLKAHRQNEPVLPPLAELTTVAVLGLSALLEPWPETVHRPEILAEYIKLPPVDEALSPRLIAEFVGSSWKRFKPDIIFLNQADVLRSPTEKKLGDELAEALRNDGRLVFAGSLWDDI